MPMKALITSLISPKVKADFLERLAKTPSYHIP